MQEESPGLPPLPHAAPAARLWEQSLRIGPLSRLLRDGGTRRGPAPATPARCFGRIPGGALLVNGQSRAAPHHGGGAGPRRDAAAARGGRARREAVERSRRRAERSRKRQRARQQGLRKFSASSARRRSRAATSGCPARTSSTARACAVARSTGPALSVEPPLGGIRAAPAGHRPRRRRELRRNGPARSSAPRAAGGRRGPPVEGARRGGARGRPRRERDEAARREAARARESAAGERPNSVRLRDVHDRLSTDAISSWGGEIEGATGLTCQWHDQGWGNRKGMVFARTTGGTPYYGTWQPLSGNEAPHAITRLGVQLPSSLRRRRIQFGYRVGGGGGHEIHIEQAVVNVQGGTAPAPARPTGNAAARERPSYNAAFAVNQRVEVRCRGGNQWFTGKITAIRGDRLYDILYDDEDSEARVAESRIRRWVSTPHTG